MRFALAASVALSVVALWPRKTPPVVGAADLTARGPAGGLPQAASMPGLPATLSRWPAELASVRGDPFAQPVAVPTLPPPAVPAVPAALVASAPPAAPAVEYRYFGRMTSPDGQLTTLLARGDSVVAVSAGMPLHDGYVVQGVSAEAVRLTYPPLGTVVDIPIPPPPSSAR